MGEVSIINPTTDKLPDKFIYIDLESVTNGELTKEAVVFKNEAPSRAQRVLERDDILFQMVRPYQKNNLYFDKNGDYVASTGYAQIKTKQSSRFIYQYLHLQKFVDKIIERCTGTSYPAINSKDLAKINIRFPSLPEQQKIASFFTAIDKKITELKQKKNLLEQYKKGVMQKIFSQEIRLKDDNRQEFPKWEKKKIMNIFKINAGGDIDKKHFSKEKTYPFIYPVFSNSESNKGLFGYSDLFKVEEQSITVTGRGALGYAVARYEKYYPIVRLLILIPIIDADVYFYQNLINKTKFFVESTGVPQLTAPQISNYKISYPHLTEQKKIAIFLSAIDDKINHTQKQIEKAVLWKKGLLQKMFV